jgi:hypothetical protein
MVRSGGYHYIGLRKSVQLLAGAARKTFSIAGNSKPAALLQDALNCSCAAQLDLFHRNANAK